MSESLITSTLTSLLNRIPKFYNKTIGTISTPKNIMIPAPPSSGIVTIGTTNITSGSSDIVQLMSSVSFSLDFLFANIQTIKDISYIGQVPLTITAPTTNNQPLFPGYFEYTALPGNILNITSPFVYHSYTIPPLQNTASTTYTIITNVGTKPFICEGIIINYNQTIVFNWRPEIGYWQPAQVSGYDSTDIPNTLLITNNPINAIYVPGPLLPGFTTPDQDPIGNNFGVPRIINEDDLTYKKRINQSVTGSKIVPSGIISQFEIIYGVTAQIFQWFPSSYSQLVTYLTANPGFEGFYLDGTTVTSGTSPLDLTASQGPYNTFYVVISGSEFFNYSNGVYANYYPLRTAPYDGYPDWTFLYNQAGHYFQDSTIGPGHHGGFFRPNEGEPGYSNSSALSRFLYLISYIKAAGTYGVLVITP